MTDEELQGIAAQGLGMARADLNKGPLNFVLAAYHAGEPLHRMRSVEKLIIQNLGEKWLNHGRAKDVGFTLLRKCISAKPPDALVFVTAVNRFEPTLKMMAKPFAEQMRIAEFVSREQAIKDGLYVMYDCLAAIAQNPERVCIYSQDIDKDRSPRKPRIQMLDQANFWGRQKMYGDPKPPDELLEKIGKQ